VASNLYVRYVRGRRAVALDGRRTESWLLADGLLEQSVFLLVKSSQVKPSQAVQSV
jgi:hypothetical protein